MKTKFAYWHFINALTEDQCDKIIKLGDSKGIAKATTRGDRDTSTVPQNDMTLEEFLKDLESKNISDSGYIRDSFVSWFNDKWVYDLVWPYLNTANKNAGWHYDYDYAEQFQYTVYHKGGIYVWHVDSDTDHHAAYPMDHNPESQRGKIRKLSMTVNLSKEDEYEGGNLKFDLGPHCGDRYIECIESRKRGSIIVFPSSIHHQVTPITKGIRHSLVMWSLGKPFR